MAAIDDKILWKLGEMSGDLRAIHREHRRVGANLKLVEVALQQQGKAIAALPCHHHAKRLSDLYRSIGQTEEVTGRIELALVERNAVRKWWMKALRFAWEAKLYWLPIIGATAAALAALTCL